MISVRVNYELRRRKKCAQRTDCQFFNHVRWWSADNCRVKWFHCLNVFLLCNIYNKLSHLLWCFNKDSCLFSSVMPSLFISFKLASVSKVFVKDSEECRCCFQILIWSHPVCPANHNSNRCVMTNKFGGDHNHWSWEAPVL